MKKGDKIKIYQKPITQEDFEGEAILVKCLNPNMGKYSGKILQRWDVKFPDGIYERGILT